MKKRFIVANWKSYKTNLEAKSWLQEVSSSKYSFDKVQDKQVLSEKDQKVILCSSFTLLSELKLLITNYHLPFVLGAQDISPFGEGAYTGEVNGKQIKEFADYVIVGHSERRKHFGENEEMVYKKIEQALRNGLTPILCVSDIHQFGHYSLDASKIIIAYEPLFAIGSGNPDTPENANNVARQLKEKVGKAPVLYGGSVTSQNVKEFLNTSDIDGVLVGSTSLNPSEFATILSHA